MSNKPDSPTRTVHVYDEEVLDFVTHLVSRTQGGSRSTKDFDDRKRTRSVLKQLGAYEMYMKMTDKRGVGYSVAEMSTAPRLIEMTVDAIDYFLSQIKDVAIGEAMRICELEERLLNAKQGVYATPPDLAIKALEPVPNN